MKVMHVIYGLNIGGAETLVKDYAIRIDKNVFDVCVLCLNHSNNSLYEDILKNCNIEVIYVEDYLIFKNKKGLFSKIFNKICRFFLVRSIIRRQKPDVIHSHLLINQYIKFSRPNKKTKLIYTMHGDPQRYKTINKSNFKATKWLVKKYNMMIICLHSEMAKEVERMFNTNNVDVLNNGIDVNKFSKTKNKYDVRKKLNIPSDSFVIGHIGRFNKVKNHIFLVDIFRSVYSKNNKAFLLMIGSGEEINNIKKTLYDYNLNDNYLILSNRDDIPDLLKAMDCFVLPSLSEGLGISLIEAQESKLPCIVSDAVPDGAIISNLVKKVSLSDSETWIEEILQSDVPKKIELNDKEWNINEIIKKLEKIYLSGGK